MTDPAPIIANDLVEGRAKLTNKRGLHARASAKFAALVQSYDAKVEVTSCNNVCASKVVGDSIMELLLLGSACGEDLCLSARGPQAQEAVDALVELIENKFGEEA